MLLRPLIFSASLLLLAATNAVAAEPEMSLNEDMTEIGALMSNLLNEKVLADPKATITRLDKLGERFVSMAPHAEGRGPAFRITWQTMLEQIDRTREAVDRGTASKDSLRNLVHGIATACAGCHTQDDRAQALSFGKLSVATDDPLQQARFHYITRDYAAALKLYDAFLDSRPRLAYDGGVLDALEGELTIFAQIYRDPERGVRHFRKRLEQGGGSMSKQVRKDIEAWIRGFDEVRRAKLKAFEPSWEQLESYAGRYVLPHEGVPIVSEEKEKVAYLWMRGLLHEYVQTHPADPNMPQLLYWLAIVDRMLDYNLYYSLADLYLKECITRYPATDTAERCYTEYRRYVEFAYSGSGGENVPADVVDELARLYKLIESARAPASGEEIPDNAAPTP
ncbi:MAG: hypothetical protein ACLGHG_07950 [Gammaproteobacteria bacterium]